MFLYALATLASAATEQRTQMTVEIDSSARWSCVELPSTDTASALASGSYWDRVETTGWGELRVRTTNPQPDAKLHAFAAGCVEARLTATRIYQYWANYVDNEFDGQVPESVA